MEPMVKKPASNKLTWGSKVNIISINAANDCIDFPNPRFMEMNNKQIVVDPLVVEQLVHLVLAVLTVYNDNSFHNFAHASHVTQSVSKLLLENILSGHMKRRWIHESFVHVNTHICSVSFFVLSITF